MGDPYSFDSTIFRTAHDAFSAVSTTNCSGTSIGAGSNESFAVVIEFAGEGILLCAANRGHG